MATIALVPLFAAGVAEAGVTGVAATVLVGAATVAAAYIDTTYTYPAIFGTKGADGPRLDDLRTQNATEGSPYTFVAGSVRQGGTVIWTPPNGITRTKHTSGGGSFGGSGSTTYTYSIDIAVAFGGGARQITKLWANGKVIYDVNFGGDPKYDGRYEELCIYPGDDEQTPDPLMQSFDPDMPAYRGTCYLRITRLQLADFGNQIPQFQAVVEQDVTGDRGVPLPDGIDAIMKYAGWSESFYDIGNLDPDVQLRGIMLSGPTTLTASLEPLLLAFNLAVLENNGVLSFIHRENSQVISVTDDDLGINTDQPHPIYTVTNKSEMDMASEIQIRFLDVDAQYDQGQKNEKNPISRNQNVVTIDMPIVLKPDEARKLAQQRLYMSIVQGQEISGTLPPAYAVAQESDVLQRQIGARTRRIRTTEVNRGWNNVVEFNGYFEQLSSLSGDSPVYTPGDPPPGPLTPADVNLYLLDIPSLQTAVNAPGIHMAACRSTATGRFSFTTVFVELPGASDYTQFEIIPDEATAGSTTTALSDPPAYSDPTAYYPQPNPYFVTPRDDVSSVTVELLNGELLSKSDLAVRNGANWAVVGTEIIGFVDAELIADRTYTLTKLYRGVYDTQGASYGHASGERFVLLDEAIAFQSIPINYFNQTALFKGVPSYGSIDMVSSQSLTWKAENVTCFRPYDITATLDGKDIRIFWKRDTRNFKQLLTRGGPLEEPFQAYTLSIWEAGSDPDSDAPIRSLIRVVLTPGDDPDFTYTETMQIADGRTTPGAQILVRLFQNGALVSEGHHVDVDNLPPTGTGTETPTGGGGGGPGTTVSVAIDTWKVMSLNVADIYRDDSGTPNDAIPPLVVWTVTSESAIPLNPVSVYEGFTFSRIFSGAGSSTVTAVISHPNPASPTGSPLSTDTRVFHVTVSDPSRTLVYVATAGDDSTGTGSSGSPYKTMEKALTVAPAGAHILLKRGDTFDYGRYNQILKQTIRAYGSGARPIVNYIGPRKPTINGQTSYPVLFAPVAQGQGVASIDLRTPWNYTAGVDEGGAPDFFVMSNDTFIYDVLGKNCNYFVNLNNNPNRVCIMSTYPDGVRQYHIWVQGSHITIYHNQTDDIIFNHNCRCSGDYHFVSIFDNSFENADPPDPHNDAKGTIVAQRGYGMYRAKNTLTGPTGLGPLGDGDGLLGDNINGRVRFAVVHGDTIIGSNGIDLWHGTNGFLLDGIHSNQIKFRMQTSLGYPLARNIANGILRNNVQVTTITPSSNVANLYYGGNTP